MRSIRSGMSQHLISTISLYVFAVLIFLLPSVSTGVALDQGASGQGSLPDFQQPNVTTILGQTNTPGQLKMSAQKNVPGSKKDQSPQYIPGEVLVKFKPGVDDSKKKHVHDKMGTKVLSEIRQIGVHKVKSKQGKSTEELVQQYKNDPDVLYAEPNGLFYIQATPNDPEFGNLWGLHNTGQTVGGYIGSADADIDAPEAWDTQTGSTSVIVADIDTGVDYNHPDLAANIWTNPGEIAGNGVDDDANGYIDDVYGWDFANNDNDPMDDHGHGTHTSGTIAAKGNNGIGVVGVSWQARIMSIKFMNAGGYGGWDAAANAVLYAARMGAKVSSNSYGGGGFSQTLQDAISEANQQGMLFVAAAGNSASNNDNIPTYPCNYTNPNVICVAATDSNDVVANFSNYGVVNVDLAAPGVNILSTVPVTGASCCTDPSGYKYLNGTSMATPHVAGAAALLLAGFPTFTVDQVKNLLIGSVDSNASLNGKIASGGRLNINNALRSGIIVSGPPAVPAAPAGQTMTFSITVQSLNDFSGPVTLSVTSLNPDLSGSLNPSSITLAANGTATSSLTVVSTVGMTAGVYSLTVQGSYVNPSSSQTETRLGTVNVAVQTDLAMTALAGPSQSEAGGWFTVTDTVQNQGPGLAKGFYVGYYLSTDNVITESDTRIGSRWISSLSSGATSAGSTDVWVPSNLLQGTYYLGAIVDDLHRVQDSNSANNSAAANAITIAGADPDSAAWVSRYNDPGNFGSSSTQITLDASGNSIVTGVSCKDSICVDSVVTIIKYGPDGAVLWIATLDSGGLEAPAGLGVDGLGNVYVTAWSCYSNCGVGDDIDYVTTKYDANNGNALWPAPVRYSQGLWNWPHAMTVDSTGNVYVTGQTCAYNPDWVCSSSTIKYGTDGSQLWVSLGENDIGAGRGIAVDGAGNVYVTVEATSNYILKYGPNGGAPIWKSPYQPTTSWYNRFSILVLDAAGNIYVSGDSLNESLGNMDIATVKYDNNGNQRWVAIYDNGGDDYHMTFFTPPFKHLATDSTGNVYVSGLSSNGSDIDYATVKYDTDGNFRWVTRFSDAGFDIPYSMAVDGSGNSYVTGRSGRGDYATIKYDPNGRPAWYGRYGGWDPDVAYDLVVDSSQNVYVTGVSSDPDLNSAYDSVTIKYKTNGADLVITDVSTTATNLAIAGSTVSTTVKNRGSVATAVSTTVGIYLSTDANITTADTLIGSRTITSLAAGQTSTASTSVTVPVTLVGTYYLGAIADINNTQPENSETNNSLAGTTTIIPDTIAPTAPTNLVAVTMSATQVNLSWAAATDNVGVLQYQIDRCSGSKCSDFVNVDIASGTSYSSVGLTPGTTYKFRVWAIDAAWNYGPYSIIAKATTLADTVPPSTPTNLTATAVGVAQIDLTWNPSTDNTRVEYYKVERCTGSTCSNFVEIGITYESSYSDTSLTPGTDYRYQVRAMDAASLHSSYSNNATAKTWTDTEPPTAPADLAATYISRYEIGLGWAAATDNSGVVNYKVERCTGLGCSNFIEIAASTNIYAPTTHYDTGLTGATSYCYRVRAYDVTGNNSGYSNTTCVTTLEATPPSTPTALTATAVSNSQINLTWTASTDNVGVVGYLVERCMGSTCTNFVQVGYPTDNSFADTGLTARKTYRYRVQAYDAANNISASSNIASATTPR